MTLKQYINTLDKNKAYWLMNEGDLERLNNIQVNPSNLYIVFECSECSDIKQETVFHAVPYTQMQRDKDGYVVCCPQMKNGPYQTWVFVDNIPEELKEIFNKSTFKNYD